MNSPLSRCHAIAAIVCLALSCMVFDVAWSVAAETPALEKPAFAEMAQGIKPWLIEVRKDLHGHPELGFEETRTSARIKEFLRAEGIEFKEMAKTGACAIIRGKRPGATVAIRADMDALPVVDLKKVEYASKNRGKCHACGHDAHTTILMGTARLLQAVRHELPGNVKLLFEPAKEIGGGAAEMVEKGALKNPDVDALIGLHMCHSPAGTIFVKKNGPMHVASSPIRIRVEGEAGHSVFVNSDANCVLVGGDVLGELHKLTKHLASTPGTRLGIGRVEAGIQENVTSKEAVILGTIRCVTREGVMRVRADIEKTLKDVSARTKCKCVLVPHKSSTIPVHNEAELVDLLSEIAAEVLGAGKCRVSTGKSPACFGGESFGFFSNKKPSLFFWLGGAKGRPHAGDYVSTTTSCRWASPFIAGWPGSFSIDEPPATS